jgi:MoxR-like ATPase
MMQSEYVPNAALGMGADHPVVILLDELGKAMKCVKDALLPLLLEGRIGSFYLPQGSQVIATSNLAEEGLGDSFEAHALNRMTVVEMRKPTAQEWMDYASRSNRVVGEVLAFVNQFPSVFESYRDEGGKHNSYIHDPAHPERTAFVTPRSLVALSDLVMVREYLPHNVLLASMVGTVGESAARDMLTLLTLADALPSRESVHADPVSAKVPAAAVAQLIFGLNLIRGATIETANAVVVYVQRLESEIQAVLAVTMVQNIERMGVFSLSPGFAQLATKVAPYMG